MNGEVDAAGGEGFVDFFGEQAFAADVGEGAVLHRVAGGGDDVFLEDVHAFEDGAEFAQDVEKVGGLDAGEGGAAGADFEGELAAVRGNGDVEGFHTRAVERAGWKEKIPGPYSALRVLATRRRRRCWRRMDGSWPSGFSVS
jgi:hypothetical protein